MIRFIRTAPALAAAAEELAAASEIALDTEFHVERRYSPELMLLQLRGDDGDALLVDPHAELDLAPLAAVLGRVPLVVHGGATDVRLLWERLGVVPTAVFDTQLAAGFVGDGYPVRLQELVRTHLGLHMGKGETLSDWSRRPLSPEQITYAAEDVLVLAQLKRALVTRVAERGNAAVLAACTEEHMARAVAPTDDDSAWRTIPGAVVLDGPERAVLRALAAWREAEARARDVPRNSVANDANLLDIARRRPTSEFGLRANRRMPSQVWRKEGAAVLRCVREGLAAEPPGPAAAYPRGWWEMGRAFARAAEQRTGIAAELTFPDRIQFDAPLDGWRRVALGEEFLGFIRGEGDVRMPECWRFLTPF